MGASQLQQEFQSAALEVEEVAGETFKFRGGSYRGVINQQPIIVALTTPGMSEMAEAMLAATAAQFTAPGLPGQDCADNREIIHIRDRDWKIVSYEHDTVHVRFGLRLAV